MTFPLRQEKLEKAFPNFCNRHHAGQYSIKKEAEPTRSASFPSNESRDQKPACMRAAMEFPVRP